MPFQPLPPPPPAIVARPAPAPAAAPAPEPMADETGETAPIVVIGLRSPAGQTGFATTIVDGEALRAAPGGRVEEALARVGGVAQFRRSDSRSANPSAQGITLRGLGGNASSRALLTLDGVPLADGFFGAIPFAALDAETLAAVDVQRGGGAGAFGAGALTGALAFRSIALADRAPWHGFAAVASNGDRRIATGAVAPFGRGHIALDASHEGGDGFWTTPLSQRVPASVRARFAATRVALTGEAAITETMGLQARVAAFDDARTLRFAGADSGVSGIDASVRAVGGAHWRIDALAWAQARDFRSVVVSATSYRPTLDQFATPSSGWGAKIELRPPPTGLLEARFGADLRGSEGVARENALAPDGSITRRRASGGEQRIAGLYAELGVDGDELSTSIGVRLDHWRQSHGFARDSLADGRVASAAAYPERDGLEPSARAAFDWRLADGVSVRGAAYTGFRLPTLNELYRGFTLFPVVTRANPALDLERLRGWQLGLSLAPATGLRVELTAYRDRLAGAIGNVTIGPNLRERRNLAAIVSRGIEASGEWTRGAWRLNAAMAYADPRVEATRDALAAPLDGLRPAQTPQLTASARVAWTRAGWRAEAGLRHTGSAFEDDRNLDRLPPATLADVRLGWQLNPRVELALAVENLFDEQVVTRSAGGSIDLGAPRTGWLTLRWQAERR